MQRATLVHDWRAGSQFPYLTEVCRHHCWTTDDELRSSPRRKTTDSPSSIEKDDVSTEEEVDVQASLLAPRSKGSRDNAPASASKRASKKASKKAPVSEGKSIVAKKASKSKQRKSATGTTEDSQDEGAVRTVRSTSARGVSKL